MPHYNFINISIYATLQIYKYINICHTTNILIYEYIPHYKYINISIYATLQILNI